MSGKKKTPILTQLNPSGNSVTEYHHVILFNWDPNVENPFEVYQRNSFSSSEIPEAWYTKVLSPTCRHQKLKLAGLRGPSYSVFCKIEKGMVLISLEEVIRYHLNSSQSIL